MGVDDVVEVSVVEGRVGGEFFCVYCQFWVGGAVFVWVECDHGCLVY